MCIRDSFQRPALVPHVPLDGLDEVGDQVVPPLELHVDLAPRILHLVAGADQAVVHAQHPRHRHHDHDQDHESEDHRLTSPAGPPASSGGDAAPEAPIVSPMNLITASGCEPGAAANWPTSDPISPWSNHSP